MEIWKPIQVEDGELYPDSWDKQMFYLEMCGEVENCFSSDTPAFAVLILEMVTKRSKEETKYWIVLSKAEEEELEKIARQLVGGGGGMQLLTCIVALIRENLIRENWTGQIFPVYIREDIYSFHVKKDLMRLAVQIK